MLLKILLITIILYFILARTSKYWLPLILNRLMKRMANRMNPGNFSNHENDNEDVTLKKTAQKKKRFDKDEGDYVDFEEID